MNQIELAQWVMALIQLACLSQLIKRASWEIFEQNGKPMSVWICFEYFFYILSVTCKWGILKCSVLCLTLLESIVSCHIALDSKIRAEVLSSGDKACLCDIWLTNVHM